MTGPTGPDVQRLGHAVLLQGNALTIVLVLARAGAQHLAARDGYASGSTKALLDQLMRAHADARASAGPEADVREQSNLTPSDSVGSGEVAGELDITVRHVRRIALEGKLPGHRTRHGWQFSRADIDAYLADRKRDHS